MSLSRATDRARLVQGDWIRLMAFVCGGFAAAA